MHTYRKLFKAGIENGVMLHLLNDISGGGKRGRTDENELNLMFAPAPQPGDLPIVSKCLQMTTVDYQALVRKLTLPDLHQLKKVVKNINNNGYGLSTFVLTFIYQVIQENPKNGKTYIFARPYLDFVPEFAELQESQI